MPVKYPDARSWGAVKKSADGLRWSAYPNGDKSNGGASLPFSTNFPATENPISQSGIWTNGAADGLDWHNIQTGGGLAYATAQPTPGHFDDNVACLSGITFNANHYAQATIHLAGGYSSGHEVELYVRMNISAHSVTGYEFYQGNGNQVEIVRWNGALDDFTVIATANHSPTDGDVMRLEASGSTITAYINGSQVMQVTDTTWATGHAGMGFNPWDTVVTLNAFAFSAYSAGNL